MTIDPGQVSVELSRYSLETLYFRIGKMHYTPVLTADLIKKYDTQVPRYTSYPTAPQFHENFDGGHFKQHSMLSNSSLLPKDLSIYVHVPCSHSLPYFCACKNASRQSENTQSSKKQGRDYLERLLYEIAMRGKLFSEGRLVTQIHFCFGTASFLNIEQVTTVLDQIALQFHLDLPSNLEISIELDPRTTSPLEIEHLAQSGINRFSIGLHDFSKQEHKKLKQGAPSSDAFALIEAVMRLGKSLNVDIISGLPMQTFESVEKILSKVIDAGVSRVSAYNLANLAKSIKAIRTIDSSTLPSTEVGQTLSLLVHSKLIQAGYNHIGMDHYVLPTDALARAQNKGTLQLNLQGYTSHRDTDLVGVGANAISKLDTAFSQNESTLSLYNERIDDRALPIAKGIELSNDDRIRADVIQQVMCRDYVDLSATIGQLTEINSVITLFQYLQHELVELEVFEQDGLVLVDGQGFEITETGRYFRRPIASIFDRYLKPKLNKHVLPFSLNM
ncbi:MAG: oxygen-independent coproporphyrinogen-3 oxidase [Arenicella sp.]